MLKNKTVLVGVTGSIAAYKAAELVSLLIKQHAEVHVIMTENATKFISPITFETLSNNKCPVDTFDRNFQYNVEHISLAKKADVCIIAPATANVIAKLANGIADDMLTTTVLACRCPKIVAPAMNTAMYENPVTQRNLKELELFGWEVMATASGRLACGDVGSGKCPEPSRMLEAVVNTISHQKDMKGLKVLVTAGATRESLDPVRFITNHSTGKMGYAIAAAAAARGAEVTLVSAKSELAPPAYVNVVDVVNTQQMFDAVTSRSADCDIIIKAAAVSDYRPAAYSDEKVKKKDGDMSIALERTPDILKYLGEHRAEGQFLCGFSMETQNMLENSRKKLEKKNLDMIAANNLKQAGAGFGTDTNVLTLITADSVKELPLVSKREAADMLLDEILLRRGK
ncbi:MAG: bifunctional phosphopantothenoylcysteine decarboxylase/phosphopantothenate--cysteine ligase CoaBC [Oscillospiraceae bacterium]|nr:bifunctional phosphopantothenoylcysteine decarboxylase/phosphopantothenate--cysteine ligase CoaBC [Oscillospiraceae bacterium]MBQ4539269.1 bifunctional phosphopantothenoylcysteine decarboxylase/phosphopantothenate--cysteine ligase CoaBC [Oscillospiraceae bacterium]